MKFTTFDICKLKRCKNKRLCKSPKRAAHVWACNDMLESPKEDHAKTKANIHTYHQVVEAEHIQNANVWKYSKNIQFIRKKEAQKYPILFSDGLNDDVWYSST